MTLAPLPTQEGSPDPVRPLSIDINVLGTLYRQPTLPAGWTPADPVPPADLLAGWHVNVRPSVIEVRPELAAYVVTPRRLRTVWEGDDPLAPTETLALRFADRDEAAATAPDLELHLTQQDRDALRAAWMAAVMSIPVLP